jgi:hypothetical protein
VIPARATQTRWAATVMVVGFLAWLALDLDMDGLSSFRELQLGTDPTHSDTDRDGLGDGWEVARGLLPKVDDMDGDGLPDGADVRRGGNPRSNDTDADGLLDASEPEEDCNGNGIPAIADADDDSDRRIDGAESIEHRCHPDVDDDGVLDGEERADPCIELPDCDGDGLSDAQERDSDFDPLNPDTFGVRLPDSVLFAFREQGQRPSADADADGIPDEWERGDGLIEWGPLQPQPGRPDLLIEFVRVQGPDSGRFAHLSFLPMYQRLADVFAQQGGIALGWAETVVRLDDESRPPSIPSRRSDHYANILSKTRFASNPYVTTLVLNPQHDQSEILHLGVAPIRGMLGAVDYGAHARLDFSGTRIETRGNQTVQTNLRFSASPFLESVVAADRQDAIRAMGFLRSERLADGRYRLVAADYRLDWQPLWFRSAPLVTWNDGTTTQLSLVSSSIPRDVLASTTLHELGHTLGLCHLELPDCAAGLPADELAARSSSTMGPNHAEDALRFLNTEWKRASSYLACPPDRPLVLLAQGRPAEEILDAKYGYALEDVLNVDLRRCGEFSPVPGSRFEPASDPMRFQLPEADRDPPLPAEGRAGTFVFSGFTILLAAMAWVLAGRRIS